MDKAFDPMRLLDSMVAVSQELTLLSETLDPEQADADALALCERILRTQHELKTTIQFLHLDDLVNGRITGGLR